MADSSSTIFNKKATEKLRSPDDLDKYIRVTNPSSWAVIAACVALLAGLLAWGVFGAISTSVTATATHVNGKVVCFLGADDATKVTVGDAAYVGGTQMIVTDVAAVPLSRNEARAELGTDYLLYALVADDWAYRVTFDGADTKALAEGVPLSANITTERVAPITLIFG